MRKTRILISSSALFFLLVSAYLSTKDATLNWDQVFAKTSSRAPAANGTASELLDLVHKFPFSSRLDDYLQALGITSYGAGHSGANEGLAEFNNKMLRENPCFNELAARFYDEIRLSDFERYLNKQSIDRPKLSEELSKDTDPKAGFLWDLAMQFSSGDPNLAMSLIGVCGHDDAVSVEVGFKPYADTSMASRKSSLLTKLRALPPVNGFKMHDAARALLAKPGCPASFSAIFQPKSLGESADIPASLKKSIAQAQVPTKGESSLPAKSYHLIAGAVSTCLLYQRNVPSLISQEIHEKATDAYRSKTICTRISSDKSSGDRLAEVDEVTNTDIEKFVEDASSCPSESALVVQSAKTKTEVLCRIFRSHDRYQTKDKSALKERLRQGLSRADAAYLLSQTNGFKEYGSCQKIDLSSKIENSILSLRSYHCLPTWSRQRCLNAFQVLSAWSLDFKWTREQHLAGERFARKNCKALESGKDRLSNACVALEKLTNKNMDSHEARSTGVVR